jgi:hypothetical protein
MELHELHIRDLCVRVVGKTDPVTCRDRRISGVGVNAAASTRCQHRRLGFKIPQSKLVELCLSADASTVVHQQRGDKRMFVNRDVFVALHRLDHRPLDFPAGLIEVVNDSISTMSAFSPESEVS